MEMRLCPNNHYYDHSITQTCPICNAAGTAAQGWNQQAAPVGVTTPVGYAAQASGSAVPGYDPQGGRMLGYSAPAADNNRTQAIMKEKIGIDPVVGWLVCLEGKEKGHDYRIHSDNNYIGRADEMDIAIRNDDTISRVNHAILSYDPKEKTFYFGPGSGRGIVRINGKAVLSTIELAAFDKIDIGNTNLVFVPFCGEDYNWFD